jgi:hypothetical protein
MTLEEKDSKGIQSLHGQVVAVISGGAEAQSAVNSLREGGFAGGAIYSGEELVEKVDAKGENAGLLTKALRAVQDHLSEETNYLHQYQEEARVGKQVVTVPAKDIHEAEQARDVLERHGAHNIRFFDSLAVVDLELTNPTARSDNQPPASRPAAT